MKLDEIFNNDQLVIEAGGVGKIVKGVNTTPDVGPNEIKKQAKKFGFKVDKDGRPPVFKLNELQPYRRNPLYKAAVKAYSKKPHPNPLTKALTPRKTPVDTFIKSLEEKGFKKLGKGMYGYTLEHPSYPWVFKLFSRDDGYKLFLDYALTHQDNPYLPKIKGKYIKLTNDSYVVRLEKLKPIQNQPLVNNLEVLAGTTTDEKLKKKTIEYLKSHYPDILKILRDIKKIANKTGYEYYIDTHGENIMQRADGTPVITDPLS